MAGGIGTGGWWRGGLAACAALAATAIGLRGTQDAVANGDTRTILILHEHTKESAAITFRRNGSYDPEALKQLNWLLRDWRIDEPIRMEPRLFDIVWQVYREVGADGPIHVVSAYRSPGTNAMLRRRSKAVSEQSQHMAGRAMDFYIPGTSMARVREVGMRLQEGGVGFYPNAYNPFVHLDAGSVRSWPRMSHDQLARLFPDGRTVHLPREGRPLAGYEVARAEILSRGGSVAGQAYAEAPESGGRKSLWATLFGGSDDEDSDFYRSPAASNRSAGRTRLAAADYPATASANNREDAGMRGTVAPPGAVVERSGARRGRQEVAALVAPAALPGTAGPAPGFEATSPAPRAGLAESATAPPPGPPTRPAELRPDEPEPGRFAAGAPRPPSRPDDLPVGLAFLDHPLPPGRPEAPARPAVAALRGEMRVEPRPAGLLSAAADDPRAALRALFDSAASDTAPSRRADVSTSRARAEPVSDPLPLGPAGDRLRMRFSAADPDLVRADRFRGPAVASLPTLR